MTETRDGLLSLVYTSTATRPFTDDDLELVHARSRHNNERSSVTGLLLSRQGRFLQLLEGPEDSVRERMSIIAEDPRHADVHFLVEEQIERRRFPHWAMEYRPIAPSMADTIPGYEAVFGGLDHDGPDPVDVQRPLEVLLRWYQARAAQSW